MTQVLIVEVLASDAPPVHSKSRMPEFWPNETTAAGSRRQDSHEQVESGSWLLAKAAETKKPFGRLSAERFVVIYQSG